MILKNALKNTPFPQGKNEELKELQQLWDGFEKKLTAYIDKADAVKKAPKKQNMGDTIGWDRVCDGYIILRDDIGLVPNEELSFPDFQSQGSYYQNTAEMVVRMNTLMQKFTKSRVGTGHRLSNYCNITQNTLGRKSVEHPEIYEKRYLLLFSYFGDRAMKAQKTTKENEANKNLAAKLAEANAVIVEQAKLINKKP